MQGCATSKMFMKNTYKEKEIDFRFSPKICTLLGCYSAYSGNSLQMFRDNLSVPSSKVENPKKDFSEFLILKDGTDRFPETSVRITTTLCVINQKSADSLKNENA